MELPTSLAISCNAIQSRKMKRLIPEAEKDLKYWEKRLKNNEAAKRSRENKRHLDSVLQTRVRHLEEENACLKRELSLLKEMFNVPESQQFIKENKGKPSNDSEKQYKQYLLKEYNKSHSNNLPTVIKSESNAEYAIAEAVCDSPIEQEIPFVLLSSPSTSSRKTAVNAHVTPPEVFNDDRYFLYSQKDLGTPPKAHSPVNTIRQQESAGIQHCDIELVPADLSIRPKKRKHEDDDDNIIEMDLSTHAQDTTSVDDSVGSDDTGVTDTNCLKADKTDTNSHVGVQELYGQELTEKIQRLSDQVLKMQKLVNINN